MTDISTLTGTELERRIRKLMGLTPCGSHVQCWNKFGLGHYRVSFTTSLDALKSGPEKMLREAGWEISVSEHAVTYIATWWNKRDLTQIRGSAPTEERARAEAVCLGLEAGK